MAESLLLQPYSWLSALSLARFHPGCWRGVSQSLWDTVFPCSSHVLSFSFSLYLSLSPPPVSLSLPSVFYFSLINNFHCQGLCISSDTDPTKKYSWMWICLNVLCATLYFSFFTVGYLYCTCMSLHAHKHAHALYALIS